VSLQKLLYFYLRCQLKALASAPLVSDAQHVLLKHVLLKLLQFVFTTDLLYLLSLAATHLLTIHTYAAAGGFEVLSYHHLAHKKVDKSGLSSFFCICRTAWRLSPSTTLPRVNLFVQRPHPHGLRYVKTTLRLAFTEGGLDVGGFSSRKS
jgi:hypothetical protein